MKRLPFGYFSALALSSLFDTLGMAHVEMSFNRPGLT